MPNPQEMAVIANLTSAQLDILTETESQRLTTEYLNPPTVLPMNIGLRGRRQTAPEMMLNFDDQIVLIALENENACNAVLRASANSIIEELRKSVL